MSQIVTFELISVLAFQPSPILPDFTTAILIGCFYRKLLGLAPHVIVLALYPALQTLCFGFGQTIFSTT